MPQYGFHFDQSRCTGCFTCVVACRDWHDASASWIRIKTIEKGKYPNCFVLFQFIPCYHCLEPACAPVCPADAITKREEDGIVVVDREACLGETCSLCVDACPYDIPRFGPEADARMQKCDLCIDRWEEGRKPACVDSCPTRALDAGPLDELRAKYGDVRDIEGFEYFDDLVPSIKFKPKNDGSGLDVQKVSQQSLE